MTDRKIKKNCSPNTKNYFENLINLSSFQLWESKKRKIPVARNFETVGKIFQYTAHNDNPEDEVFIDCFALKLCRYLMEKVEESHIVPGKEGSYPESFYISCINDIAHNEMFSEVDDKELLIIYLKQMVHLMRAAELLPPGKNKEFKTNPARSTHALYMKLFNAFWFYCKWEEIFPSDPAVAAELQESRTFIKDLLLGCGKKTGIDIFSNQLFELTGLAEKNDIITISFLDFYLLTWLKHFGVTKYFSDARYSPVCIQLTELGRKLFSNLG